MPDIPMSPAGTTAGAAVEPLTSRDGVLTLMRSSRDVEECNRNCAAVRDANALTHGGKSAWYAGVLTSNLFAEVAANWTATQEEAGR